MLSLPAPGSGRGIPFYKPLALDMMQHSVSDDNDKRPFPALPRIDRYFAAASTEEARLRLTRAINRGDGPGLLIGASGTGKTLLLEVLAAQFRDEFEVAFLSCAQLCTRRALLQAILFEMGLPYRYHEEGELRLTLLDHLVRSNRCPGGMLLLVDEAQSLPSRLLEEIRLMSNLVRGGKPRVRVVLAGSPALEEQFAAAELESFQQRIATRCYLAPLNRTETTQYVRAHLAAARMPAEATFEAEAINAVFTATDGVPRLVNQLCDHALLMADQHDSSSLSGEHVQQAWADLQQLPTPWETEPEALSSLTNEAVVEFGQLADVEPASVQEPELGTAHVDDLDVEQVALPISEALPEPSDLLDGDQEVGDEFSVGEADLDAPVFDPAGEYDGADEEEIVDPTTLDEPTNLDESDLDDDPADGTELSEAIGARAQADKPPQTTNAQLEAPAVEPNGFAEQVATSSTKQAQNPFGEPFAEEEVVLEHFSALGTVFGFQTPRVAEIADEEHMSTVVERVLRDSESRAATDELAEIASPANPLDENPHDGPPAESEAETGLDTVPLTALGFPGSENVAYCDPVYPDEDLVVEEVKELSNTVATIRYPGVDDDMADEQSSDDPDSVAPQSAASNSDDDSSAVEGDDILQVEDSPADVAPPSATVRREDYSQLFANLRRK